VCHNSCAREMQGRKCVKQPVSRSGEGVRPGGHCPRGHLSEGRGAFVQTPGSRCLTSIYIGRQQWLD